MDDEKWEQFFEIVEGLANSDVIDVSALSVQILSKLFSFNSRVMDRNAYDEIDNLKELNVGNLIWYAVEHEGDSDLMKT